MRNQSEKKTSYAVMAIAIAWLSVWTPACLAMGAAQVPLSATSVCDCKSCSEGCLACACVQVDGVSTYAVARSAATSVSTPHAPPAVVIKWLAPIQLPTATHPAYDQPPPVPPRSINLRYCVFLK